MSAEDAAMNSMTSSMSLALNGVVYACKGSAYVIAQMIKLMMWIHLEHQKKVEIDPGKRKLATMIAAGKKTQCLTMKKSDYEKMAAKNINNQFHSLAERYGIQFAAIDQTKMKDNENDYVTVFIDSNHWNQFNQLCKDQGFKGVENHGVVEAIPDMPYNKGNVTKLFDDPDKLKKYVDNPDLHNNTSKFDLATFYHDEIKKGMDPDGFITELTEPLVMLCRDRGYTIDLTGFDIRIPELEKEVAKYLQGELKPETPAVEEPLVTSNDTTISSENQKEQSKESEPSQKPENLTELPTETPAVEEPVVTSNDTTISSENQKEQSKDSEPAQEHKNLPEQTNALQSEPMSITEPSITEEVIFDAPTVEAVADFSTDPSYSSFIEAIDSDASVSYEDKITEITEESKTVDIAENMDPTLGPEIK